MSWAWLAGTSRAGMARLLTAPGMADTSNLGEANTSEDVFGDPSKDVLDVLLEAIQADPSEAGQADSSEIRQADP